VKEIFASLVKEKKWYKYKRDAKVGDVVLRKDETAAGQMYKYARIISVHVGSDGKVGPADEEYKIPRESKFRVTTRPIHKLVLMVPVEEPEDLVEDKEEAVSIQEGRSSSGVGEGLEKEKPAQGGPSTNGPGAGEGWSKCV
jgi:hypothetical protein